jgi:peptidoglycan/xylan/chitin deacetylase (PgdA/CDA1 family)
MKNATVTTSWDDGNVLDMKLAELLNRYHLPATFYISMENKNMPGKKRLPKDDIQTLSAQPAFEIGAHTMTHPKLSRIDDDAAREEITISKHTLENWIGKPVNSFCYPFGDYLPKHKQMVENAGFSIARTVERFRTDIGKDRLALPTTVHAYQHLSDVSLLFSKKYLHWDELAIALFDKAFKEGGVFHLWGHSWEIEKRGDWNRLERVFAYIANHPEIQYLTNGQLI